MNISKQLLSIAIFFLVVLSSFSSVSKVQAQSFNCCGCNSAVQVTTYCDKDNHCYECTGPDDPSCPGMTGACLSPAPACACGPPPTPPPSGGCSSGWCTSSSTCAAIAGSSQSSGAGACSPPDLV